MVIVARFGVEPGFLMATSHLLQRVLGHARIALGGTHPRVASGECLVAGDDGQAEFSVGGSIRILRGARPLDEQREKAPGFWRTCA